MAYENLFVQLKLSNSSLIHDEFYEELRKKLLTDEAEAVAEAVTDYVNAIKATNRARLVIPEREHPDWQAFLRSVAMNCETQTEKLEALRMMVYGERPILTYLDHWFIYNSDEE